eukprot:2846786-Rhodomonas_salina.2
MSEVTQTMSEVTQMHSDAKSECAQSVGFVRWEVNWFPAGFPPRSSLAIEVEVELHAASGLD